MKKRGVLSNIKKPSRWIILLFITLLYPILFLVLFKLSILQTFLDNNLVFIFSTLLFPIACLIFFSLIIVSFKNKFILIGGAIGAIIGIFSGIFSGWLFASFSIFKILIYPLASIISFLARTIIVEHLDSPLNIYIYTPLFALLFALIGALIGNLISKRKKNVRKWK